MTTTTFIDKQTLIQADWLNDVNASTYSQGTVFATAAQTIFTIPFVCSTGLPLNVYISGIKQAYNSSYTRTSSTQITFTEGVPVGSLVEFHG